MQYQQRTVPGIENPRSDQDLTVDFDPSKPQTHGKFSFVKFLNRPENSFDSLQESIDFLEQHPNPNDLLFTLGLSNWKPKQDDKNYQLIFNKNEEIIISFEGDILNRDRLVEFLLLTKGKLKEAIQVKQSSSMSLVDRPKHSLQSDEELLLNLFKHFLNDCLNDVKAFRKLAGLVEGPLAMALFNKKQPQRLLCFWRDIPIYLHGQASAQQKSSPKKENSSFISNSNFSSVTVSTAKSESWTDTCSFPADTVHLITLLPQHEIAIKSKGPPIAPNSPSKNLIQLPSINAPEIESTKIKSHLRSEIFEQPAAIKRLLRLDQTHLEDLATIKLHCLEGFEEFFSPDQRLVITGCGSSFFAGTAGARFLQKINLFRDVRVINSVEFDTCAFALQNQPIVNVFGESSVSDAHSRVLLPQNESTGSQTSSVPLQRRIPRNVCIAVTQSGESSDVLNFLRQLKESLPDSFIIALTNSPGSSITRLADARFFVNSGKEFAVAATKSVTNTIVAFHLLGLWFEYLFKGPRRVEHSDFKSKGKLYQKVQALSLKEFPCSPPPSKCSANFRWSHFAQ